MCGVWFFLDIFVAVLKVVWTRDPLEFDVEGAEVAVITVVGMAAVDALVEPSERPAEVTFWRFCSWSVNGASNRPRSKDMIVRRRNVFVWFVVSLYVDFYMIEL